jgi:TolB-like protein
VPGIDSEVEDIGPSYFKHATEPVPAFRVVGDGTPEQQPPPWETDSVLVPALAIIPFTARLVQPPHDIVGELLADSLIARISRTSSLRVISRLSTSKLSALALQPERIHEILKADFALSGSFSMVGDRIVLIAEFSRTSSGEPLWVREYRFETADLLAADSETLAAISADMMEEIAVQEMRRARHLPLPSLEAFTLQIAATTMMHRSSEQDFSRSRDALEHLIERHARVAAPRAWLATWYVLNATRGRTQDRQRDARIALDHTRRALDADPSSSLAMAAEGFIHLHLLNDLEGASAILDQAVASNRSDPMALIFQSIALGFSDFGAEALEASEQALSLSPIDPLRYYYESLGASSAYCAGNYRRAISLCDLSLRKNKLHLSTHRTLIAAHVAEGDIGAARRAASSLLRLAPRFTVEGYKKGFASARSSVGAQVAEALLAAGIPAH